MQHRRILLGIGDLCHVYLGFFQRMALMSSNHFFACRFVKCQTESLLLVALHTLVNVLDGILASECWMSKDIFDEHVTVGLKFQSFFDYCMAKEPR